MPRRPSRMSRLVIAASAVLTALSVAVVVRATVAEAAVNTTVQAEAFSAHSGVIIVTKTGAQGGRTAGYLDNGDWSAYAGIDLTGAVRFNARVVSGGPGGTTTVRADSTTGPVLGAVSIPNTGGWESFADVSVQLSNVPAGTHTLYLMYSGGGGSLFDIDAFTIVRADSGPPGALPRAGWTATASVSGEPAANMLDGNASTRWTTGTAMAPGQSITVDTKATRNVSGVWMDSAGSTGDYARGYQIYLSTDGATFGSPVASGTGTSAVINVSFAARSARYIRVVQTGSHSLWWSIAEFHAFGSTTQAPLSTDVHLFYYPWYGGSGDGYRHWTQGGNTPPNGIGANFYPTLGAYDSGDFAGAVAQHMAWVRQSGAGTIVVSWWGQNSYEDQLVPGILNAAQAQGIKVAWHLEPYGNRTAASTVADINYINSRYGSHPAFYRAAAYGNRSAFYVFESLRITDWTALDQVRGSAIVLAQTTDTSKVAHFGGMYTYDAIAAMTAPGWKNASDFCRANGLVWAPSVGPGYIDDRAVPGNTTPTLARNNGASYDTEWRNALQPATGGRPTWVSVTSFNEWHEGSSVEPARSTPPAGFGYQTYSGAYGTTGAASETAYLNRTQFWVNHFVNGTIG